ncbi:MAG: hypothetical protein IPN76_02900 [Saprospiraceae bacterium]|nr:hypothetical protein [Saprospiraceae bacterium]
MLGWKDKFHWFQGYCHLGKWVVKLSIAPVKTRVLALKKYKDGGSSTAIVFVFFKGGGSFAQQGLRHATQFKNAPSG